MEEERLLLNNMSSAEQVAGQIMSMSDQKRLLIIGLLWAWWDARNKANAGEKRRLTEEVVYKARSVLIQVQEVVLEGGVRAVRANGKLTLMRRSGQRKDRELGVLLFVIIMQMLY